MVSKYFSMHSHGNLLYFLLESPSTCNLYLERYHIAIFYNKIPYSILVRLVQLFLVSLFINIVTHIKAESWSELG